MADGQKLKVAMLVVDANEVRGTRSGSQTQISPVLHPAVHNLLDGLKAIPMLEVEVVYGREHPKENEERRDGSLHFVPVRYVKIPLLGMGGAYLGRAIALRQYIRNSNPNLVHAQGTERESGLVAAHCNKPSLLTLHGNFREIARKLRPRFFSYLWINAKIEGWVLPKVDGIICISNYARNLVRGLNSRGWVVPNAVSSDMFSVKNSAVRGRIVCIASIDEIKNQVKFLRAADALVDKFPYVEIQFWGSANSASAYSVAFMEEVNRRPWVSYKGVAEAYEIGRILSEADVLVLPSIEDNCPVVILEAMAAGVPVVASRVGGIPDLVIHGETGFMAACEDQPGIVSAIQRILESEDLRKSLAARSRREALDRFQPQRIAEIHHQIYREVADCMQNGPKQ